MMILGREVLNIYLGQQQAQGPPTIQVYHVTLIQKKLKLSLLTERRKALHKTHLPPGGFVKAQKEGRQRNQQRNKQKSTCMCKPFDNLHNYCVPLPTPTPFSRSYLRSQNSLWGISFFWQVIKQSITYLSQKKKKKIYSIIQVMDEFSYLPQYIFLPCI